MRSASTSSVTFFVPISAANADPDRPITTIAVISGPNSRKIETITASGTRLNMPNFFSSCAICKARIRPNNMVIIETIGIASTPTAMAW